MDGSRSLRQATGENRVLGNWSRLSAGGLLVLFAVLTASPCIGASPIIEGGKEHTTLVDSAGTLWTWGKNSSSQLGYDTGSEEQATSPWQVDADKSWRRVAAGDFHTLAIDKDGHLYAWGDNMQGQLGIEPDTLSAQSPVEVPGGDWVAVAAGSLHSVGIRKDGSLWAWGNNNNGQLGIGSKDQERHPSPQRVGNDSDWVAVAAGGYHNLALKQDGSLWAWGDNDDGQLGLGSDEEEVWEPRRVGTGTDWIAVAGGLFHSLGIKQDGTLWAWGSNEFGQMGTGTADTTRHSSPEQIGSAKSWVSVAAGGYHSLAIRTDGSLWAWGSNQEGQLGYDTGNDDRAAIPQNVGDSRDWAVVAAGELHSLAVKQDGTLWAWGRNQEGQLGDATTMPRPTPEQLTQRAGADEDPPTIQITPAGGSFGAPVTVSISATDDAPGRVRIFYTVDGSAPTPDSLEYTGPFAITATTTLRALAVDVFGNESNSGEVVFTMGNTTSDGGSTGGPCFLGTVGSCR